MYKIVPFRAALVMVCAIAFSVCFGSCDKEGVNHNDDENSMSLKVDTNGVQFTLVPFISWGASQTDAEKYITRYYPDLKVSNDGKLQFAESFNDWYLRYDGDNMCLYLFFAEETGNDLEMVEYNFDSSVAVDQLRGELTGSGLDFKGLLYWDYVPDELTYLYLSSDEKLEVQLGLNNYEGDFWYITFQPTDKSDMNQLIDQTTLSLNIYSEKDSCCVTPMLDWGASLTDVKRFMEQNYPDWEIQDNGELISDTISEDSIVWYTSFQRGNIIQFLFFDNAEGDRLFYYQFVDNTSTDEIQIDRELTRNGLEYKGYFGYNYEGLISNHVYVPLSKDYIVVASAWETYGGCRVLEVFQYYEDFLKNLKRD